MLTEFLKSQMLNRKSANLTKLGFDFSKPVEDEYQRIQSLLSTDYLIKCESMLSIMKKYKIPSSRTMDILFRLFDIEARSFAAATSTSLLQNRAEPRRRKYQHIRHTSWYGASIYMRSSYELDYAKQLDEQKIMYYCESVRIQYYDSVQQKYRIAVPDFYLPETNTIVEIKATYWYDKQNMDDKSAEYQKNGYNFKLILDKELVGAQGIKP